MYACRTRTTSQRSLPESTLLNPVSLLFMVFLTHPRTPSLKSKGRGVIRYILVDFTLPLLFKGRDWVGLRNKM
jgi:hypothetical protein